MDRNSLMLNLRLFENGLLQEPSMINFCRIYVIGMISSLCILWNPTVSAFPENVRMGYQNCSTCHVSPTGGGLLTPYGSHAAKELLNTWTFKESKKEEEAEEKEMEHPRALLWGGDVRGLGYLSSGGIFKRQGLIPMQIEGEAAYKFWDRFTLDVSAGIYDLGLEFQRYYLLATLSDHLYTRVGRFFPAYGIFTEDHTVITRRGIGFDQNRESYNIEVGLTGETGEIVVDGILSESSDSISANEVGGTLRAAWYTGSKSQVGASFLYTTSDVWSRTMYGFFTIIGFTKHFYLLSEVNQEFKVPTAAGEVSTSEDTRVLTYNKLGWEFLAGVHGFGTFEDCVTTVGSDDPHQWSYGPGVQWFPIPHLEMRAQWQQKSNSNFPNQPTSLATLMVHYYF